MACSVRVSHIEAIALRCSVGGTFLGPAIAKVSAGPQQALVDRAPSARRAFQQRFGAGRDPSVFSLFCIDRCRRRSRLVSSTLLELSVQDLGG